MNAWLVGTVKEIREGEGVDVEIEENADAFAHISNISWFSFSKIADVLKIGDKREFRVLGIDKAKYRILLGLKQMEASPWDSFMHKYKEGSFIDVKILEIDDAAILCQIVEGVNGRLPIKNKNKIPYKKGDIIKAKINKIDKDQKKVYLSSKELESLEEKKEVDNYIKTHEHKITMNDIVNFGDVEKQEEKQGQ